jgi:high-affinity nickel-transport protein
MLAALSVSVLGFASGMRHALEPDHLAAVSTFVAGEKSRRASVRYAAAWGAGHGAMLVAFGGALAVFHFELPPAIGEAFELIVACVLVALGVRGLAQAARGGRTGAPFEHAHGGGRRHAHGGAADHVHVSGLSLARLPFAVGLVHGLAGSGAIAALVAARLASSAATLGFIGLYATGAMVGMAALAGVLGFPLARLVRSRRGFATVVGASAVLSLVVGLAWAAPILLHIAS